MYRSERPRVTSQKDDHLMERMVVRSPTSSTKKMRSALLPKGTVVSKTTTKRRLTDEFGLKVYKSNKKPRLIPSMKAMILARLTWFGLQRAEEKFYFLDSQLCSNLHLASN